jgi:hypothetical protein
VVTAERRRIELRPVDLDSLLPPEHRARAIWAVVEGLDPAKFYEAIAARGSEPGRPAIDPKILPGRSVRAQAAAARAARERAKRGRQALAELPAVQAAKATAAPQAPARVSTTDAAARGMKIGDAGFRPADNAQLATTTEGRAIVGVQVANRGSDTSPDFGDAHLFHCRRRTAKTAKPVAATIR